VPGGRYSERDWRVIAQEIARVRPGIKADSITVQSLADGNLVPVRAELERLAREYIFAMVAPRKKPSVPRRFIDDKRAHLKAFRHSIIETGELPTPLQARAETLISEIDRHFVLRMEELAGQTGERWLNAAKADLDAYFEALVDVWMMIRSEKGTLDRGSNRMSRSLFISFVEACANPVVTDNQSVTRDAIAARLRRLHISSIL
jgi:hypothetical protein